jgi:hypothetical protein
MTVQLRLFLANVDSARSSGAGYWRTCTSGDTADNSMRSSRSMGQHKSISLCSNPY